MILDLPDPDVDALRGAAPESVADYPLYSRQFMSVLRSKLAGGGAFVSHCGPIAPGGDPSVSRPGLTWISELSQECGFGEGAAYHVIIPSFQSEWGFFMSVAPSYASCMPEGRAVMDLEAQTHAFCWPRFWNSPYIGHVSAGGRVHQS